MHINPRPSLLSRTCESNAEQDLGMNMACYDLMGKHLDIPA